MIFSPSLVFDAFGPNRDERASGPASVRTGMRCVTGAGGDARGRRAEGRTGPEGSAPPAGDSRTETSESIFINWETSIKSAKALNMYHIQSVKRPNGWKINTYKVNSAL